MNLHDRQRTNQSPLVSQEIIFLGPASEDRDAAMQDTLPAPAKPSAATAASPAAGDAAFRLDGFFPYLVRLYYQAVSGAVADIYGPRFGLTVSEWRTMVVLGPRQALSAGEIVARSSMDKVAVSRAIGRLRDAGLLKRDIDGEDRRRAVLRLTEDGCRVFDALVPLVLQRERDLLEGFTASERETLLAFMARIRRNASALTPDL